MCAHKVENSSYEHATDIFWYTLGYLAIIETLLLGVYIKFVSLLLLINQIQIQNQCNYQSVRQRLESESKTKLIREKSP